MNISKNAMATDCFGNHYELITWENGSYSLKGRAEQSLGNILLNEAYACKFDGYTKRKAFLESLILAAPDNDALIKELNEKTLWIWS